MEIHIERKRYCGDNEHDHTVESVGTVPYKNGIHQVEGLGTVGVVISKYKKDNGAMKVLFVSKALRTKKSKDRRVVGFPTDMRTSVSQEVTPTEKLIFKRMKDSVKGGE